VDGLAPVLAPALNPAATETLADRARSLCSRGDDASPNARAAREACGWYVAVAGLGLPTGWDEGGLFSRDPRHQVGSVTSGGRGAPTLGSLRAPQAAPCELRALRVDVNDVDTGIVVCLGMRQMSARSPPETKLKRFSRTNRQARIHDDRKCLRHSSRAVPHFPSRPAMHAVRLGLSSRASTFRLAVRVSGAGRAFTKVGGSVPAIEPFRQIRHVSGSMDATSDASAPSSPVRVAVVGGGLAGLTAASRLARGGCAVTVYETGRGPGGRTSTRRAGPDGSGWQFDHGAQVSFSQLPRVYVEVSRPI